MATLKNGPLGNFRGRIGNMVTYPLHGEMVVRMIGGVSSYSAAQQEVSGKTGFLSRFLKPLTEFTTNGFKFTAKPKLSWNYYHMLTHMNNPGAVKGRSPDFEIDFPRLLLAMGDLPVPKDPSVELRNGALNFKWTADLEAEGADEHDQVMLLAYFPALKKAVTVSLGAYRGQEQQQLKLTSFTTEMVIETYMAFINHSRGDASNSVYLGQVLWTNQS